MNNTEPNPVGHWRPGDRPAVFESHALGTLLERVREPMHVVRDHGRARIGLALGGAVTTSSVPSDLPLMATLPAIYPEWNINQAIACFAPLSGLLNAFLAIYLQSDMAQRWLLSTSKNTTSQVNLAITTCPKLPIPHPPLAEQHRIVAEVDRLLSVLDRVEARITPNLSRSTRLRQAILKRAFEGRLVPQDAP